MRGRRRKSPSGRISCQSASTSGTLVKKRWPPRSKRQPSRTHRPADAAHDVVGLEDDRVRPPLGQLVGRGEAPRPRARDHHRCVLSHRVLSHRAPGPGSGRQQDTGSTGHTGQGTEMFEERQQGVARQGGRRAGPGPPARSGARRQTRAAAMVEREGAQGVALEGVEVGAGHGHRQDRRPRRPCRRPGAGASRPRAGPRPRSPRARGGRCRRGGGRGPARRGRAVTKGSESPRGGSTRTGPAAAPRSRPPRGAAHSPKARSPRTGAADGPQPGQPPGRPRRTHHAHELDRHDQGEQHARWAGSSAAANAEQAGQGEVRPGAPRPGPACAAPGRSARKQPIDEAEQGGLGVAHDQHEGGGARLRNQMARRATRGSPRLPAHQDEEQHGGHEGGHVGDRPAAPRPSSKPGSQATTWVRSGDGGEEAERLRPRAGW